MQEKKQTVEIWTNDHSKSVTEKYLFIAGKMKS